MRLWQGSAGMLVSFALVVVGALLFGAGIMTGNPWLVAPGLVLVPVGFVTGLRG